MGYWITFAEEHPGYEGMDALADENDGLMTALTWAHDQQRHEALLALCLPSTVTGSCADVLMTRGWPVPGRSQQRRRQRMHLKHSGRCTNWRCSRPDGRRGGGAGRL